MSITHHLLSKCQYYFTTLIFNILVMDTKLYFVKFDEILMIIKFTQENFYITKFSWYRDSKCNNFYQHSISCLIRMLVKIVTLAIAASIVIDEFKVFLEWIL